MKKELGRTITALRKKRGISQKEAASELGISQALLSHYEKGIRECGLEFLVRLADYYEVSADYLLGRNRQSITEISSDEDNRDVEISKSNTFCLLNRRILANSAAGIYSLLSQINSKKLTKYVSDYLTVAEYNAFRKIYSVNGSNSDELFKISSPYSENYCFATLSVSDARIKEISQNLDGLELSADSLSEEFPDSYASLNELIKNAEKAILQNHKLS